MITLHRHGRTYECERITIEASGAENADGEPSQHIMTLHGIKTIDGDPVYVCGEDIMSHLPGRLELTVTINLEDD